MSSERSAFKAADASGLLPIIELGLWQYRKARFSRYGSLPETLVALSSESGAGYDGREFSEILGVRAGPELSRLFRLGRIRREKLGGCFIYVSSDEKQRERQLRRREAEVRKAEERARLPVSETVLAVLVELVRHPGLEPESLVRRLKRKGVPVTKGEVENIFTRYDLAGKKGP